MIKFTITAEPRTKKNHQEIRYNLRTGKRFVAPSRQYEVYLTKTTLLLAAVRLQHHIQEPIDKPVNVKAVYYMGSRRVVDISNLHECLHDVLVNAGILADDSCRIIISTDGSRVRYDKDFPRTEVEIEEITDEKDLDAWADMLPKSKRRKSSERNTD